MRSYPQSHLNLWRPTAGLFACKHGTRPDCRDDQMPIRLLVEPNFHD